MPGVQHFTPKEPMKSSPLAYFTQHPRQLFLLDGIGALSSSVLLGIVLIKMESFFGMPRAVLIPLSAVAVCLAIGSFFFALFLYKNPKRYLYLIAGANTVYCIATCILIFRNHETLTWAGTTYFILEIIIILFMATLEFNSARHK